METALLDIIRAETLEPPARVTDVMDIIRARHDGRVQAVVYYGSSLRELDNPEKMLDFYVLVDSYRKTHGVGDHPVRQCPIALTHRARAKDWARVWRSQT